MIDLFEKCAKPSLAAEAKRLGIYPYFHALESKQDVEVIMEGKRRIMLGSNNYLGLTTHPEVIEAGVKAYQEFGSGCSGSRFLNGTLTLHLELEAELARFLGKPGIVTFSTGFQSNLGIISAIVGMHDYVIMDRENHASLYDGCRLSYGKMLRFRHNDMEDLEKKVQKVAESAGCLIVTAYGLEDQVDIYMGTFSKSLASLGGYMAASEEVADYVRHASRPFIFSASIPPANCAAALTALRILEREPDRVTTLQENALYLRKKLGDKHIKMRESNGQRVPIVPIYTYEEIPTLTIAKDLYEHGVYVNSSLPPAAAPHECLLRTSLMATHTHALIDEAVDIIAEVLGRYDL